MTQSMEPDITAPSEELRNRLQAIRKTLEPALVHAPYRVADGKVVQANNHPDIRPYVFSQGSVPVLSAWIASAPETMARLLAAVEAAAELHEPKIKHFHAPEDSKPYRIEFCGHDGHNWPCPTVTALSAALGDER